MARGLKLWAALALLAGLPCLAQQAVEVPSLDASDGSAVVLPGHWYAAPGEASMPAMVLLHGCGGAYNRRGKLARRYTELAARLNAMGVRVAGEATARAASALRLQQFLQTHWSLPR